MSFPEIRILGLTSIKEIVFGDRIGDLIVEATQALQFPLQERDILVITQKVVSKAEGRVVRLKEVEPSTVAREWAWSAKKDPRLIEVLLSEARRVVRMDRGILIVETRHGFICANAGVDTSNVEPETVTLLPIDPDESAREIREEIKSLSGVNLVVIISDTFGRPWREGLVSVALGVAGMDALLDYRGQPDGSGQLMQTTVIALADELASAAELVMGKNRRIPAALLRGVTFSDAEGSVKQLLRSPDNDLFR